MMRKSIAGRLRHVFVVTAASSSAAYAAVPAQVAICDPASKMVDRERLAMAVLGEAGVSAYPYRWVVDHPADYPGLSPAQHILVAEDFCAGAPDPATRLPRCASGDRDKIGQAQNLVLEILRDERLYGVPNDIRGPASLFANANVAVTCKPADGNGWQKAPPTEIASPIDPAIIPIRLRGSTDGLQFDRNRDQAFAGVDKANITFKDDRVAGKETFKSTIVAAMAFPLKPNVLELVPYFGFSIDTSKKGNAAKEVTDDTGRAGLLIDFRSHQAGLTHLFLLRPEYAANRKERSEVISANFTYQPVVVGWLNDGINILTGDRRSLLTIIPRADARLNWGHFLDQGSRAAEDSENFLRLGGQLGLTVTSDVKWLPIELSVSETYLRALNGSPRDLSQLKAIFSLYFDAKKFFGVDATYVRGRREDLAKREQNWSIGFGAKF